ncbi:hypothetical protein TVAG_345300 [Trichomonas vaginalis G3]|uniref:Uncharacterized protein n=1 Tax=Trichomonas vaginalis (strain ATCC PRA-98 / G3) TaxID=412133 RepID=A2EW08_TRIV3|nr:hypothetical protein TVAGG3_0120500 [Trichomonas vaginalis G3]EAY03156.1 hypothetical protein TVAG_345300 [Trichomonas vaginalis G3]KAI5545442.1 hypothetical protein TVAGG3_0120500 [Trichomonas vaginalis G3]|eukprot:XP_001315379.1 hypothetical protein [Trichomonas vaginalis G3]
MNQDLQKAFGAPFSTRVAAAADSDEFRHYQYTIGNPVLKRALDQLQTEKHQMYYSNPDSKANDKYLELAIMDLKLSSNKVVQYGIEMNLKKQLAAEKARLKADNEIMQTKIKQLKASLEKESKT